jgi:hypothetical protein
MTEKNEQAKPEGMVKPNPPLPPPGPGLEISGDDLFRYIGKLFAELQKTNERVAAVQQSVVDRQKTALGNNSK